MMQQGIFTTYAHILSNKRIASTRCHWMRRLRHMKALDPGSALWISPLDQPLWISPFGSARAVPPHQPETGSAHRHGYGAVGDGGVDDAHAQHAVVALGTRPRGQLVQCAGDGLVQQGLVFAHAAADGVDDRLAHVAQDVGAADGHGVDHLAALDGAIHGLGGEKLHQRYSTRGLGPSSARFSISRRTRPRSAADTNTRPCFSHSSTGVT